MKELKCFNQQLATLIIGTDTLLGGDIAHESGTKHVIADSWFSDYTLPAIYYDLRADILRKAGGVGNSSISDQVHSLIKHFNLLELADEVRTHAESFEADRQKYIHNLVGALEIILKTAMAMSEGKPVPSHELRYRAATGSTEDIKLVSSIRERDTLRKALAKVGYESTTGRNLRDTFLQWKSDRGVIPPELVETRVRETSKRLLDITRKNLCSKMDFLIQEYNPDLSDVAFDGHTFKTVTGQFFTGSSAYKGGMKGRKPALAGLFEYNLDHPLSATGLVHLCSHEVIPGHYLNTAMSDLFYRAGKLPFEASMGVMCTPSIAFQEGWAQNAFQLLYGSIGAAAEEFGADLEVEMAMTYLEDVAKHNVAIMHQKYGFSLPEIGDYLREECVLPDPIIKKLSGAWAQHPVFGAMYGPAYYVGRTIVGKAIQDKGREKVAKIGFQLGGLVDIQTFKEKIYR